VTDTRPNLPSTREEVPQEWPPICTAPERDTKWVSRPVSVAAMVGLWFCPKRVGAAIGATTWRATLMAHLIGLCFGIGLIAWAEQFTASQWVYSHSVTPGWPSSLYHSPASGYSGVSAWEWLRSPLAALAMLVHGSGTFIVPGLTLPWAIAGLESATIAAAFVLAPFIAVGEAMRLVLVRSIKLSLWGTTMLIPLGIGWMCEPYVRTVLDLPDEWHPLDFVGLAAFAMWWLTVLLRSGFTYAGPPKGSAWEPRSPRCESCGYAIVHLNVAGRCPECGRPIAMSLADRRRMPRFATAVGVAGKAVGFFSTIRAAGADKGFFDGLAVHRGHRDAKVFFILSAALNSALLAIVLLLCGSLVRLPINLGHPVADLVVASCACFLAQLVIAASLVWFLAVVGRRPICAAGTLVFYRWTGVFTTASAFAGLLLAAFLVDWATSGGFGVISTYLAGLAITVVLTGAVIAAVSTVRIARNALRNTRFANG
jgi:predicted RNA-binding Zn-ribbon protein involved in translation (DUF1610 family)